MAKEYLTESQRLTCAFIGTPILIIAVLAYFVYEYQKAAGIN